MKLLPSVRTVLTLTAGCALLAVSQGAFAEPLRLNFGVYSSNKPSAMVRVFKPALNELESRMAEKLGREVDIRMQIAKDYDQGISHLTTGKVDFSRFGPASYIEAKKMNEGIEILAMESKGGAKVFYGIIATKSGSSIQSIEDLRDQSFAFGDEGSTIGRFLSQLHLEQHGIHADDLSKYEYLGRHDRVGTAVGAGDFAAGALNESTFKKLTEAGEQIVELDRFPNVTKPWIARSGLDPVIFEALQLSLLEIRNEQALKGLKIVGFLEGDDTDYSVIREAMDFNYKFFDETSESTAAAPVAPQKAAPAKADTEVAKVDAPATTATSTVAVTNTAELDAKAIAAATGIIAEQAAPTAEPVVAAALPMTTAEKNNAELAAKALANVTPAVQPASTASMAVQSAAAAQAPSNIAVNGNSLTINIDLPPQLMNQYGTGTSQNITINLSFPSGDTSVIQANQ